MCVGWLAFSLAAGFGGLPRCAVGRRSAVGGCSFFPVRLAVRGLAVARFPWLCVWSRPLPRLPCRRKPGRFFVFVFVFVLVLFVLFLCYTRDLVFTVFAMFSPVVSSSVLELVSSFGVVAFSGGRSLVGPSLAAARWLCSSSSPSSVLVGCAPGADAVARFSFPSASVFSVVPGSGRGGFAARSVQVVRSCVGSSGLWVSFPSSSCPPGLLPSSSSSRSFCGSGSGSWASLSFAVGCGLPCLVYLAPGIVPPVGWSFVAIGSGWFLSQPVAVQSSLF